MTAIAIVYSLTKRNFRVIGDTIPLPDNPMYETSSKISHVVTDRATFLKEDDFVIECVVFNIMFVFGWWSG